MRSLTAAPSALLHPSRPSFLLSRRRRSSSFSGGRGPERIGVRVGPVAYMERDPNSVASLASRVLGALPVVGLFARILSDEGGVGGDILDFAEFRRRVGKKCGVNDSQAFYEFQERHGRAGDPLYVLLCCWVAAVGAGLLKSEEILEGVARLRISNDIEFEEQTFFAMMTTAKEVREGSRCALHFSQLRPIRRSTSAKPGGPTNCLEKKIRNGQAGHATLMTQMLSISPISCTRCVAHTSATFLKGSINCT